MKSKLHKILIALSVILLLPMLVQAQRDRDLTYRYYSLNQDRNFAHWSYLLEIGGNVFDGDIREDHPQLIPSAKLHPTIGGRLERSFNPVFGLGLQYMYIPYKADPGNVPYRLEGTAHEGNIFASINMLNLFYQSRKQRWNIYGTVGWGLSFYSAETVWSEGPNKGQPIPAVDNNGKVIDGMYMKLDDGRGYVIPLGLHVEYNISRTFALGLNGEYRMHNKDNLEGSPINIRKGNSNDAFSVLTLSLRHKLFFGKQREMHVRTSTYAEVIPMKDNKKEIAALQDDVEDLKDAIEDMQAAQACCKDATNRISDLEDAMRKIADLEDQLAKKPETIIIREEKVVKEEKPAIEADAQERIQKAFDLALRGIQFETDKAIIKTVSYPILDNVVNIMREHPDFELDIIGHTDNVGSAPYNLNLSNRRAQSVRQYLIDRGIDASRLTADGKGLTKPIATNTTVEGRQQNRRVEFVVRRGSEIIYSTDKELFIEGQSQTSTSRSTGEIMFGFNPADYEMTYVVASEGTRLALFSTQHYGSYMFWPYIYLANRNVLKPDPNALLVGTKIGIPKLPAEMIDTNNPEAVERVNQIRDQLLR